MRINPIFLPLLLFIAALPMHAAEAPKSATPLQWSVRMAESEINPLFPASGPTQWPF